MAEWAGTNHMARSPRRGPVQASPCRGLGPCDTTFRSDSWRSIGSKARNIRVTIDEGLGDSSVHPVEWLRLPLSNLNKQSDY